MKYMDYVYSAVRNYFIHNFNRYISKEDVDKMPRTQVLEFFLEWEGIYGYTTYIKDIANM